MERAERVRGDRSSQEIEAAREAESVMTGETVTNVEGERQT